MQTVRELSLASKTRIHGKVALCVMNYIRAMCRPRMPAKFRGLRRPSVPWFFPYVWKDTMNRETVNRFSTTSDPPSLDRTRRLPTMMRSWNAISVESRSYADQRPQLPSRSTVILMGLWLFIGMVAAYDVYLSVKYQETLRFQELNPLGRWLLELDNGSVAMFMGCKFMGTMITLGVIQALYWYKQRIGLTVASALAGAQALLAGYLIFG